MPPKRERQSLDVAAEPAVLAAVHFPDSKIDARDPLGELRALAETAGARVVGEMIQAKQRPEAGTFMGSGKLEELRRLCNEVGARLVIFDNDLSPSQIGNIEKVVERKIVDRSELILDIFAGRATTHEAKLQVELAQLEYTYPRLRAMWDHLERITGGAGLGGIGTRGPGEQQLEIDRRLVRKKVTALKREIEEVQARKRREVRARNMEFFTVGLVGYTNAGKSTLFNTVTEGGAYVADQLFATLMTRTREWDLGGGLRVMLSDTVGFVRDLPHNLVASFRATLEEATHADLLLVVLDASDEAAEMQHETVMGTLEGLFKDVAKTEERETAEQVRKDGRRSAPTAWAPPRTLLLLNKADQVKDAASLAAWEARVPGSIPIVAKDAGGRGHAELRAAVREALRGSMREVTVTAPMDDARAVSAIERRSEVLSRDYEDGLARFRVRIGARQVDQLWAAGATVVDEDAPAAARNGRRVDRGG